MRFIYILKQTNALINRGFLTALIIKKIAADAANKRVQYVSVLNPFIYLRLMLIFLRTGNAWQGLKLRGAQHSIDAMHILHA